jgi:hypothetical protein
MLWSIRDMCVREVGPYLALHLCRQLCGVEPRSNRYFASHKMSLISRGCFSIVSNVNAMTSSVVKLLHSL